MTDRLAIVTGATSGIGLAVTRKLLARGDLVAGVGTRKAELERIAAEAGGRFRPVALDVADRGALVPALRALGPAHTLVASAGICKQARIEEEEDDATWDRTLSVNLNGVYFSIKAVAPAMPRGGRVVVVSSGLGKLGRAGYAAYAASKHAVLGIVKCLAKELASRGITVNAVCPGWVDTPMARGDVAKLARETGRSAEHVHAETTAAIPIGRWVSADEVAALCVFLASDEAAGITGEAYNISGGEFFA
jgi:NAD(P)-dependent dehydrogenase (short-subunit alcohol dehydrogenase family)